MSDRVLTPMRSGDPAPDVTLRDDQGATVALSDLWSSHDGPTILVFLRHFGCIFCREHARALEAARAELTQRGAQVVLVGMGTPDEAAAFRREMGITFPILADPDREAYRAFGLPEATLRQLAGPGVVRAGFRATRKGPSVGRTVGNPRQLPGTFVVDRDGVVRFARPAEHAGDIASIDELTAALDRIPAAAAIA